MAEIKTKTIRQHGRERHEYTLELSAERFSIGAENSKAEVCLTLDESEIEDLLKELWCNLPRERFDAVVAEMVQENGL